jgi:uncharacterized membrane protein
MLRCCLRSTPLALALAWAALLLDVGTARADLKLCNTTTSRIGVAIGYRDATDWTTEGWWTLAAQTCETLFKGALSSRYWYVYAIDYDRGGEWAGQSFMCTTDKSFTIRGVRDCSERRFRRTGFFEVDTQAANDWTIRLTDPSEGGARLK